jgi:twinkle protein
VGSKVVGLFGLNTIPEDATEVIITEGEYDAMIAYQETGIPSVSLPNGANNLPPGCLPWLERFDKVYLWMDNDEAG